MKNILRATPYAQRVRDDWGEENFTVKLQTDSDRANLAGITNLDVAASSATAINGSQVTVLREGDKQIPIVARLRMEERAQLADMQNLYVYSMQGVTEGAAPAGLVDRVRNAEREGPPAQSIPHDHSLLHGRTRSPAVRDRERRPPAVDGFRRSSLPRATAWISAGRKRSRSRVSKIKLWC